MCTLTVAAAMTGRYPCRYGLQIAIPYGLRRSAHEWPQPLGAKMASFEITLVVAYNLALFARLKPT